LARELLSEKQNAFISAKNGFHVCKIVFGLNIKLLDLRFTQVHQQENLSGENFESWLRKKLKIAVVKSRTANVAE
jgi:hypothetical protein